MSSLCPLLPTPALYAAVPYARSVIAGAGLTGGGSLGGADITVNAAANADGSITVNANDLQVGVLASDAQHGSRGGGTQHAVATTSVAGFMSATDKSKADQITAEGGFTVWLTNKTGAATVKGTLVCIYDSAAVDNAFMLAPVNSDDVIGAVYDAGIADGQLCRVVVGGIAEVLVEAADTIQRRYWIRSPNVTAGRANIQASTGGGSVAEHFKEVGHCLETKVNGGSTLAKCVLHFN